MKLGYIVLTVVFERDSQGRWLVECRELGTAIFAPSLDQAYVVIRDAIELYLSALEQSGERERFFQENGIKIHDMLKAENKISLDVPTRSDVLVQSYVHEFAAA